MSAADDDSSQETVYPLQSPENGRRLVHGRSPGHRQPRSPRGLRHVDRSSSPGAINAGGCTPHDGAHRAREISEGRQPWVAASGRLPLPPPAYRQPRHTNAAAHVGNVTVLTTPPAW